jgi:hypothetical protein
VLTSVQGWFVRHDGTIKVVIAAGFFGLFLLGLTASLGMLPVASPLYPFRPHQFTVMTGAMLILPLVTLARPHLSARMKSALLATCVIGMGASLFLLS